MQQTLINHENAHTQFKFNFFMYCFTSSLHLKNRFSMGKVHLHKKGYIWLDAQLYYHPYQNFLNILKISVQTGLSNNHDCSLVQCLLWQKFLQWQTLMVNITLALALSHSALDHIKMWSDTIILD